MDQSLLVRLSRWLGRSARPQRVRPVRPSRLGVLRRPVTAVAILLLIAVALLVAVTHLRPHTAPSAGAAPVWIGLHEGDSIPDYIELSRSRLAALAAAEPDRSGYALVSFVRYLSPGDIAAVLAVAPGLATVTAFARVPLAGRQTERIALPAADLAAAMSKVADRKEVDARAYAKLAVDQPAGTLRDLYESNADVSRAEASAYRSRCACLFAALVHASAAALVTLAGQPDVRSVDPAPELTDPAAAVFAPPLPEQSGRAARLR